MPVTSSMIASVGYDRQEKILEVEFVNTGHVYEYYDVPYDVYQGLMKAGSKGSYMSNNIMDCYGYGKVSRGRRGRNSRQPEEQPSLESFTGKYELYELIDGNSQELNTDGVAAMQIDPNGRGEFRLGRVEGIIDGKVTHQNGETMYRFRWQGKGQNKVASGDGWLVLETEDEAEGEISFFGGDDCFFRARKAE